MGKFFDALRKSEKAARGVAARHLAGTVVNKSEEEIDKLRLLPQHREDIPQSSSTAIGGTDPRLVCLRDPTSPAAECFRGLRSKLLLGGSEEPPRVIMVTSAEPQDGKTLVAANLAVSIAQRISSYVLLMECDLRRPALLKMFGLQAEHGLREYLERGSDISHYFIQTPIPNLTLLPAGKPLESPSELLSSPKMRLLTETLRGTYHDHSIIIDTPPAYFFADTASLFSIVDGILFVVRFGQTRRELIKDLIANVRREKILGVVFNSSDEAKRDHKYYYRYYHKTRQ